MDEMERKRAKSQFWKQKNTIRAEIKVVTGEESDLQAQDEVVT